ncbi:hypothetical protein [Fodinibius salsisoli]|uniref:Cellulase (Glycosyl hydrolase family 5) n=1 Tax=Fodinibius salsisoli TaxID=2820877 RepID=A0ABT3PJH5_9BACT|nr:hypothetical protein [Fodinibius salsisoli]MCW9706064.1 hypothetical protein [Fodinibius salsisoli]
MKSLLRIQFNRRKSLVLFLLLFLFGSAGVAFPQSSSSTQEKQRVTIEDGVMRWEPSGEEVSLFGINYYTPYSQTYRGINTVRKDHKKAINEDTYHFARMGMDAFRTHLYEIEITDSLGNLLNNHHLDLHDYTIHKMSERGIKTIVTPTTYYNSGYPRGNVVEPPGFANYISKGGAPRNKEYWPVIQNYLAQLVNHENPYTGMTMIEDPNVIALEIDNEPSHSGYDRTLEFVNSMANHLRESGWDKPIFYNITHGEPEAYLDANIDGITFQWYPGGLYEGREKRSNYFPFVSSYDTPWEGDERYENMAKMVYEFDPADNLNNYALPMMARSFKEHGMQFAAQFAYTAMGIAHANNDWQSHYLNMAYTPGRAVSMMIAGEVFDAVDYKEQFENFPADTTFGDFVMSHHKDLSLMNTEEAFMYSNDTESSPEDEASLRRIAGVGSSPVVTYLGTGAYLLDKLADGVWRLEVMPDAIEIRDPFSGTGFDEPASVIEWNEYQMEIALSDLGDLFTIEGLNIGNERVTTASGGSFTISPGAYLLTRRGENSSEWTASSSFENIRLGEYPAVTENADEPAVWHRPTDQAEAGEALKVAANIAGLKASDTVLLQVKNAAGMNQSIEMEEVSPHRYKSSIPERLMNAGEVRYWIVVDRKNDRFLTFPGDVPSVNWRWEDEYSEKWTTQVVEPGSPITLWDAEADEDDIFQGFSSWGSDANEYEVITEGESDQGEAISISSTQPTEGRHVLGISTYIRDHIEGVTSSMLGFYDQIVVRAKSGYDNPAPMRVLLLDNDGNSYSAPIPVDGTMREHRIPLSSFESDRFMLLPKAYPSVMKIWYETGVEGPVIPQKIEEIQFLIDTSENPDYEGGQRYGFQVEAAWLE